MAKRRKKEESLRRIVVTGDCVIDCFEVSTPPSTSSIVNNWQTYPGVKRFARPGGAFLLAEFVRSASGLEVLAPELSHIEGPSSGGILQSFVSLDSFPYSTSEKDKKTTVYRVKEYKGFACPAEGSPSVLPVKQDDPNAEILVFDDAGNGFRDTKAVWPAALKEGSHPTIIVKMSSPLAKGALWEEIQKGHADRMIVVITADDLRQEGVKISRRLSWERTAKDFVWQMASNPNLIALNNCAYLIVRLGVEGALLYIRRAGVVECHMFFDPRIGEDGFAECYPGKMLGVGSAFVAAFTANLCCNGFNDIEKGIREGLRSVRRLWQLGFGKDVAHLALPGSEIFKTDHGLESAISSVVVPNPTATEPADPDFWCILDDLTQAGPERVAYNFVMNGNDPSLDHVPIGQFRNFRTFDRSEIESFSGIKNLIREYLAASPAPRPLSIAVFGPPGSGKSFGVNEVAESVAPGKLQKLEFNLSEFNSPDELIAAFHKVRDVALNGKIPIVFFDEFDSEFEGKLGWLKYFLAPMNDGKFRDGETTHPIGRAIFVFAGGTSRTFAEFSREDVISTSRRSSNEAENSKKNKSDLPDKQEFKEAKGPDFVSRLRGYVDIKGPNPVDKKDRLYFVRRALMLRFLLEKNAKHLFEGKKCRIDPGVLRAMIKISKYKHGVRSMLAIIEMSMLAGRKSFEQAALPSPEQLELHVDAEMFSRLVVRDVLLGSAREVLARAIHEQYLKDHKGKKPPDDPAMALWEKLAENLKESNRLQADQIPVKLAAIGCDFTPVVGREPALMKFKKEEIEIMAEMEHARWNSERFLDEWSLGPRNHDKKTSPYLVEWKDLPKKIKEYDRDAVRAIPKLLARVGFEVYRVKDK
ncbi:MAG: ATP-binding protein [bacterium]